MLNSVGGTESTPGVFWKRNCGIKPGGVSSCGLGNISSSHESQTRESKLGTVRWNRSCYRYRVWTGSSETGTQERNLRRLTRASSLVWVQQKPLLHTGVAAWGMGNCRGTKPQWRGM